MIDLLSLFARMGQQKKPPRQGEMGQYLDYLESQQPSGWQSLASSIPAYSYAKHADKYYQPAIQTMAAMGDPNSAQYQSIYKQQQQMGRDNIVDVIAEASRQNRKLSAMGRTPLFSQERGGEEVFRNLTRGYQEVQGQAANQTQDILGNLFKNQAAIGATRAANGAKTSAIKGNAYGMLAKLFGL